MDRTPSSTSDQSRRKFSDSSLLNFRVAGVTEYSTLQTLKTENIVVSIPLDYPHFWHEQLEDNSRKQLLEDPATWQKTLGRSLTTQRLVMPVVPQYETFPWAAVAGRKIFSQLETIFSDRYFLASSELNLLNTILLVDELTGTSIGNSISNFSSRN